MSFSGIAGNRGTVSINSNEVPCVTTSFKDNCKLVALINSMTQQNTIYIPTFKNADISIFIDHNTAQPVYLSPLSVTAGATVACKIFLDQTGNDTLDGPFYNVTSMVVQTFEENVVIADKVGIRITGKASGTYAYPTS